MRDRLKRFYARVAYADPVLAAGMFLLFVYYVSIPGVFQGKASGDGYFGFLYLRAIFFEQTLDMKKVIPEYLPYFSKGGPNDAMPNRCPFGPTILWAPFYAVAIALHWILEKLHILKAAKGSEPFYSWFTGLGTLLFTLIGYRALYQLLARNFSRSAARLGATIAVWATPITWYAVAQPAYQHGLAFGLVAVLVERWDARFGELDWRRFAWLGLVGGLAMEMRAQEALFLLLPGGEVAWRVVRGPDRKRAFFGGVVLIAATLIAFFPQMLVWSFYTGSLLRAPQVEPIRWSTPFLIVALFSTRGGLFSWSPIAYLSAFGLIIAKKARRLAWSLAAVFALEVYVVASAWVVTGAYAYGARRLSDGAILLGVGAAIAWDWAAPRKILQRAMLGFAILCVALNLLAMELVRIPKRVASSGGYARTAARWLEEAHAPVWMQNFFEKVGYPFVQPVGWIFALQHKAPLSAFEGVVGNLMLDRDGQWMVVTTKSINLDRFNRAVMIEGFEHAPKDGAPSKVIAPRARILLGMFASESCVVDVVGQIGEGTLRASWNGREVPIQRTDKGARLTVPSEAVNAGTNEIALEIPVGSLLARLDFTPTSEWWRALRK